MLKLAPFLLLAFLVLTQGQSDRRVVTIKIQATGLPSMDQLPPSQSDAFAEIFTLDTPDSIEISMGRTEVISDNNNPDWVRTFDISYALETPKVVIFKVTDEDPFLPDELIGVAVLNLSELNPNPGSYQMGRDIKKPGDDFTTYGLLHITATIRY